MTEPTIEEPRNNNLNILAALTGALRRCRSLAGSGHAARPASCIASRQRPHNCPTYYFSAPNCPKCGTEIKLTESQAAPLIAATRKQYEQQLAQKDNDIAQRKQAMRDKEKQFNDAKRKLDDQVADQVAARHTQTFVWRLQ